MGESKTILADNFINEYPVSKTLRFELKPQGKTLEFIEKNGLIDEDMHRAESYKITKGIIDEYHKDFIEESLSNLNLVNLEEYYRLYNQANRSDKEEKEFIKVQTLLRKEITTSFKNNNRYNNLFKKELIQKDLLQFVYEDEEKYRIVEEFKNFTSYFEGFHTNRKNMYSDEDKSTAIAYRIIHQNLPKFIDNMKVFQMVIQNTEIKEKIMELYQNIEDKVSSIDEYFNLDGFNKVLSQKGIDLYNLIIAGYSTSNGKKIQGINEIINLYNQQVGKEISKKIPKLKLLFKQILSDREKLSFIPDEFINDQELLDAVSECYRELDDTIWNSKVNINLNVLLKNLQQYHLDSIYIKNDLSISTISKKLYGDWAFIGNAINNHYDLHSTDKKKDTLKYDEKKKKALKSIKNYTIAQLNQYVDEFKEDSISIETYFISEIEVILNNIYNKYKVCEDLLNTTYISKKSLLKNDIAINQIKELLDSLKELQSLLKPLVSGQEESQKDELFYTEFLRIWNELDIITPLFNKVRNYMTKKPYSLEKVKLNFQKTTLLNGWDLNKETDNLSVIFIKDDLYYLGIMNRNHNKIFKNMPNAMSNNVYKKMEYKVISEPYRDLPHKVFAKKNSKKFNINDKILNIRDSKSYTKGNTFNIDDCHYFIDFYKDCFEKEKDWEIFNFKLNETKNYNNIDEFYSECKLQAYNLEFKDIDASYIDELVEKGELYLFQIYNKDFSPYSKGTPNLHTLYWKMLFNPENLKNVVYKLNGQAEIFYRKASISKEDMIIHKKNEPIQNKDPLNNKKSSLFEYDLIKDKRFTCDKFQFHVPITMNFKAQDKLYLNQRVNQSIRNAKDMHVIGIDRGERNLLYLTVIDLKGNIKEQLSLNQLITYDSNNNKHIRDYHKLLDIREKENKAARQNWKTINTIKELKEGYLSQVIHIISKLMIQYNAIVVLEDLNFGFMRGRQKFEKQVYQKFEKMLIDKLNYLVDKEKSIDENGGLLHAYQLTSKFESFQKLGKQSGFLYYVPAWMTSKIDPTTGFVNLFYLKYESIDKSKALIRKFKNIRFNKVKDYFEFDFDYMDFNHKAEGTKSEWTVCSYGNRIETYRNKEKNSEWDTRKISLTEEFKALFKEFNIDIDDLNLIDNITCIENASFYKKFIKLFNLMLQMRNSDANTGEDWLISPVMNENGEFFISGKHDNQPVDADANGAYNIARKGLWIIESIKNTDIEDLKKVRLAISNKEWLQYAQEHTL